MKSEMENEEVEAVLEKIWDLHDKLSDVIHSISRSHFIDSVIRNNKRKNTTTNQQQQHHHRSSSSGDGNGIGFVYFKDWDKEKESVVVEAKSLHGIRSALEGLEEQLEFLHTVQMQQRAERDAALARLEQSRIVLAMRLCEHQGRRYKVIEEALDLVGDVKCVTCFSSPEDFYGLSPSAARKAALKQARNSNLLVRVLLSGLDSAKDALKWDTVGQFVGHAALFTITMLAMVHLQQTSRKDKHNLGRPSQKIPQLDASSYRFDVQSARG